MQHQYALITKRVLRSAWLALACGMSSALAAAAPSPEYQLKASYLYHFTKFITWPEVATQSSDRFYLCVLGKDPFGRALDALAGKPTGHGDIEVQRHSNAADMGHCHLTFISMPPGADRNTALSRLTREGSLTIGESPDFLERGGVMRFVTVDDRVRFEVNESHIKRAGLTVGAKLLSVAIRK